VYAPLLNVVFSRVLQLLAGVDVCLQVISGLAGKIPLETMVGRRVIVICNLKPAKMRGLFSYAMIFAASCACRKYATPCFSCFIDAGAAEDDKTVELVAPPAAAPVGERVAVEGFNPCTPAAELNMKVWRCSFYIARPLSLNIVQFWESVAPKFRTNSACEACFDGHKFVFALHLASRS
jgi:hypothetical protein